MPDHTRAWAAVAPDGRVEVQSVSETQPEAIGFVRYWLSPSGDATWEEAQGTGWRVLPVKIVPMEGGNGE